MAHEDVQDVLRVLAICYREGSTIDALDMERVMSFDMDWLSPEEAEKSVQALIAAGWLTGPENELTPTVALEGVTSPLGWFPRPSRLIKPCQPEKRQTSLTSPPDIEARSTPLPVTSGGPQPQPAVSTPVDSNDPRSRLTPRLTKFIARQSQLPIEEVERRAKRKAKALTYASHWACLALVAREQGLVMDDITAALSVY
ncbi:MAG: DUF2240 family protein [Candidatus Poseidoniaceae archaeon]|jgi:hypothetical protein